MRVRALDVTAVRIDGDEVAIGGCTLAARTTADGGRAWDASGWLRRPDPRLASRAEGPGPLAVVLVTPAGRLMGAAYVSVERPGEPDAAGLPLFLAGIGGLDPWPG